MNAITISLCKYFAKQEASEQKYVDTVQTEIFFRDTETQGHRKTH